MEIRIGPAGWDFDDWAGIVYPAPKPRGFDPLAYLAGYFDTIEINSTFYRPPAVRVVRSWATRVRHNDRFRFTTKLWRRFTHEREQTWTAGELALVREPLEVFLSTGRLGAVLAQFPWSFRNDGANREWLRDLFRALDGLPLVLEVRHSSWNEPEVYDELAGRGIGFVNIDQPLFRHSMKPSAIATAPVGYIRVHGRNYRDWFRKNAEPHARYDYLYSAEELEPWAERALALAEQPRTREVYVVTNNHFRGKAPTNALMLRSMVEGRPVECPPELLSAYPEALAGHVLPPEAGAASTPAPPGGAI